MRPPWLSWLLLTMTYLTYGQFLQNMEASQEVWWASAGGAIALAGVLTFLWSPVRRVILMGFQSDVGYFLMVILLASIAVLAVVRFRVTSYLLVLLASSLLVRVDTLIANFNGFLSFLVLVLFAELGLALSWLWPTLLKFPMIGQL